MRKFVCFIFIVICFVCSVMASENTSDTLSKLENSVFGINYSNEKADIRVSRLENEVYGSKRNGKLADRLQSLSKDLHIDTFGQEIPPVADTFAEDEYLADSSVDYPVVNEVEKQLGIKSQNGQSLHSRLVALEKKLFNSVFDTDDFFTRVERIKGKVYKNADVVAESSYEEDDIYIPEYEDESYQEFNFDKLFSKKRFYNNNDNDSKISQLERKILHRTHSDENSNDRLARLENNLFDTEFYYDDEQERINRIEGAVKGRQTANKYDGNKLQQRLNTAMQIGAMILMVLACIL